MNKTNLRALTEKEMSQIVGGKWIVINGKWIWVSAKEVKYTGSEMADNSIESYSVQL